MFKSILFRYLVGYTRGRMNNQLIVRNTQHLITISAALRFQPKAAGDRRKAESHLTTVPTTSKVSPVLEQHTLGSARGLQSEISGAVRAAGSHVGEELQILLFQGSSRQTSCVTLVTRIVRPLFCEYVPLKVLQSATPLIVPSALNTRVY